MGWDESTFTLFDDLEQQAEGLQLQERAAEVADLSAAEYARITLAARLHASIGRQVSARVRGGRTVAGRLARVGDDWVLLVGPGGEWIVRTGALLSVSGLSGRADGIEGWPVLDRLGLRAVLRRLAAAGETCGLLLVEGEGLEGRVGRVGRDFLELHAGDGGERTPVLVPISGVAALQERS